MKPTPSGEEESYSNSYKHHEQGRENDQLFKSSLSAPGASDASTEGTVRCVSPCSHSSLHSRLGKGAQTVRRLAPTPDVIHVIENEDDILDCSETCSDATQHIEEAHQSPNWKTIPIDINVCTTIKNKLRKLEQLNKFLESLGNKWRESCERP